MQEIRDQLRAAIKEAYDIDFEPEITVAPENIEADFSSNAPLKLAKVLHKSPMEIGDEVARVLSASIFSRAGLETSKTSYTGTQAEPPATQANLSGASGIYVSEVSNQTLTPSKKQIAATLATTVTPPGFINFILPDEYYTAKIADFAADFDKNISWGEYSGKTVICEFSDPNPFKVLHVGHLYTSIVGDAISRLYEYAGARVIRANFGGDVGLHVAKTMYILQQKALDELTIDDIARCYVEGTAAYEEDPAAKTEITRLNKEIYQINAEDIHGTPLADLYWRGRELSYDYFKDFYAQIGLKFDKFYPESTVAGLGLATVEEQLKQGVYELSDGAVVFDGEKYGLHTRVFINKEGVPTYEAKDVGLIFTKWADYHFDKSVVITGNEQLDYMKVVLKSVEQYAPELVERTTHLTHGLVKLAGGVKMSSRKGNFLKAVEVLDLIKDTLKQEYNSTDEKIALAATKYAFIKYKMGGDIVFDPGESVKMNGNSAPYLLYSCVRAGRILASKKDVSAERSLAPVVTGLSRSVNAPSAFMLRENTFSDAEKSLTKKIIQYPEILQEAVREIAPHKVANYLYELAQEFSRFYEKCPVAGSKNEEFRRRLVQVYLNTMTHGLRILGITEIPEEM